MHRAVTAHVTCSLSSTNLVHKNSLIDRGADGGAAGDDMRIAYYHPDKKVDVLVIYNHYINYISAVTAGRVFESIVRPTIVIMNLHACMGKGNSIHSSVQIWYHKATANEKSINSGREQHVVNNNYVLLLSIKNCLPCMPIKP